MFRRVIQLTAALLLVSLTITCDARLTRRSPSTITFPDADEPRFPHLQASASPHTDAREAYKSWRDSVTRRAGSAHPPPPPMPPKRRRSSSSAILFPDSINLTEEQEPEFVPECGNITFAAFDSFTGQCQPLMMRGSCPEDEWFILDRDTRKARCQPQLCPEKHGMFAGECVRLDDESVCPPYMIPLMNEFGETECDCVSGAVYWRPEDRCYPAMMRGPCLRHQLLKVNDRGMAKCSNNDCGRDGMVRWPRTGGCYPLRDPENAPCVGGRMDVDIASLDLRCVTLSVNTAFDTPAFRCSRGSRRFQGNRCKRQITGSFSGKVPSSLDRSNLRDCPSGFRLDRHTGVCRRRPSGSFGGLG